MKTSYEYVGLVNYQYFKENFWKDAMVKEACFDSPIQGLPYIPRVHLSEGSLLRSPLKWLWSEEPMVRRSFIPKFLYSEICYVPKIPYSERPSTIWILCYEDSLVRSSSSPKGAMFRTSIFRKPPLPHTGSILRRSFIGPSEHRYSYNAFGLLNLRNKNLSDYRTFGL